MEETVLLDIADEFHSKVKCKKLAANLGVAETIVDEQLRFCQDIADVTFSVLAEWQEQKGSDATSSMLYEALKVTGCEELAQKFESVLFQGEVLERSPFLLSAWLRDYA